MVTGGYSTGPLDSTEMLVGAGSWNTITTASLPTGRWKPAAATINNTVYLFGEALNPFICETFPYMYMLQEDILQNKKS